MIQLGKILYLTSFALLLSGCVPSPPINSGNLSTPQTSQTQQKEQDPQETKGNEQLKPDEFSTTCSELIHVEDLYEYNPNVALKDEQKPSSNAVFPSKFRELGPLECGYVNLSSGETYSVGMAKVSPESSDILADFISGQGTKVTINGSSVSASFYSSSNGGCLSSGHETRWLIVCSNTFVKSQDAVDFVNSAIENK